MTNTSILVMGYENEHEHDRARVSSSKNKGRGLLEDAERRCSLQGQDPALDA